MTQPFFRPVGSQVRFPAVEEEVLAYWKKHDVFRASLDATRGKTPYVFYDGPPFATGLPHYGHLIAGTLKDIIPRYWTMRGHFVGRRFGWDCHGLPVENEMEKELKVSGKRDIADLGVDIFNEACRSIVLRYTAEWERTVVRMGRWVDFVNQYRTMDPPFMESIWWVFRQVWDRDLIYPGFRVQPYCPRCTTPLSNFEVNEGYRDVKGPSITVTFPLADDPSVKVLVWTTTPWTLPSNVVLAVGASIRYVKVRDGEQVFILAKDRLSAYYHDLSQVQILDEFDGRALVGKRYQPLFRYFVDRSPEFFRIVEADFVSTEDGTGIVHCAPAFGEDDFAVGQRLGLPLVCPVDDEGRFTAEVPEWKGKRVFEADDDITTAIKGMDRLVHRGKIEHRYPYCYRCDTPLIYKAIDTWFLKIDPLKRNMLDNNQKIRWVPDHLKNGRFGKWLEGARDWNISRNRYWGTPIPIWTCETCGERVCVGSLDELHKLLGDGDADRGRALHRATAAAVSKRVREHAAERLARFQADRSWAERLAGVTISDTDIHRHIVDEFLLKCPSCGGRMRRVPEVLDCWFESGSMPYAQNHYPFENREAFEKGFPADFIAEGLDQTRGWFYTLTVLSSALFQREAFKNVVVNGIVLAEDGKKLSKRLRNYTPPEEILERLGADALRLFLVNSPAAHADDLRFSEKGVTEMARAVLLPYWNAYSFFVTYATVDGWRPSGAPRLDSTNELDRWIVSLLNDVIAHVNREMESYSLYRVAPLLVDFIDNLTNWYIRRSRRRFWKSESDVDKAQAYATLHYVLTEFTKAMAPFLPFLTESIYRNLVGADDSAADSVHLQPYPVARENLIDEQLETKMRLVRRSVAMGRALRSRYTIKTRQPLAKFTLVIKNERLRTLIADSAQLIADELNVKQVRFSPNESDVVSVSAKPNYKRLGKAFGPRMRDAAAAIEALSADMIEALEGGGAVGVLGHEISFGDIEVRRTKREGVEIETEGEITAALDTEVTPELLREGMAREFVNRIQTIRKERDFNVTDRIAVRYSCAPELREAVEAHSDYIRAETLAASLTYESKIDSDEPQSIEVNDIPAQVAVAPAQR